MVDLDDELLEAAKTGNLAAVTAALEKGANVDSRDAGFGRTALMTASMHSAIPIMRALLDAGASMNLQAVLGERALILAASGRGGESIELLLARRGPEPRGPQEEDTVDVDGRHPVPSWGGHLAIHCAVGRGGGTGQ